MDTKRPQHHSLSIKPRVLSKKNHESSSQPLPCKFERPSPMLPTPIIACDCHGSTLPYFPSVPGHAPTAPTTPTASPTWANPGPACATTHTLFPNEGRDLSRTSCYRPSLLGHACCEVWTRKTIVLSKLGLCAELASVIPASASLSAFLWKASI